MRKVFAIAFAVIFALPAFAAEKPASTTRVGAIRSTASRAPATVAAVKKLQASDINPSSPAVKSSTSVKTENTKTQEETDCRTEYRKCMDDFCLLDEPEGLRCACSDNIDASKSIIKEIQKIQKDAEKLFSEGVEREKLGARAELAFAENKNNKAKSNRFAAWLESGSLIGEEQELDEDLEIGADLFNMASEHCASKLDACPDTAEMEKLLYSRMITADCKSFSQYLDTQKIAAEQNKAAAEKAVRTARVEMLDTTNKYNRGECLLAYKACISDKGGCGVNFENCMDESLLQRRANACSDVLDQCMAVKQDVLKDWAEETKVVLAQAAEYERTNKPLMCRSKIRACLEEGCNTSTNVMCLTDINVAAGICPIIDDCDALVPGLKEAYKDELAALRVNFCQNDVTKCMQDKCGSNFTAPECVGQKISDLQHMCPQSMFPSCKDIQNYDAIKAAVALRVDYNLLNGCVNFAEEFLGKSGCGTEMNCIPEDPRITSLTEIPSNEGEFKAELIAAAEAASDKFFDDMEKESLIASRCVESAQPAGKKSFKGTMFGELRLKGRIAAVKRMERLYNKKVDEISRSKSLEEARARCDEIYAEAVAQNSPHDRSENKEGSWTTAYIFEPDLRNCQLTRWEKVCETGGESKASGITKGVAGGAALGASAGSAFGGWGTLIGVVVGGAGGAIAGGKTANKQTICHEVGPIYEDRNI
ncbi:MAG: hypothetical protein ACOX7D_01630 [Alphaproteobacteria bacterium]|jgi:hypothetical protein